MPSRAGLLLILSLTHAASISLADDVLYQYEGKVYPYDPSAGWDIFNPCDPPCQESLDDGHFVLDWPVGGDFANYSLLITQPPDAPPPSLWVEWRFRSNHPFGGNFFTCDGRFKIRYGGMLEVVEMYGDAAFCFSGNSWIAGLELDAFHTYRFESLDGINYRISVDGEVFIVDADDTPNGFHYLQLAGDRDCEAYPDVTHRWDMVRYGTIGFGERVVATDPPSGYLDPATYADLDRIAVTFDAANYVYIDQITIEVSGGETPVVTQVWRRENDGPETLEIVLDKPLPAGEHTRFILDDGTIQNVIDYSFILCDADGDGDVDLDDYAAFVACLTDIGDGKLPPECQAFDTDQDADVDMLDFAFLQSAFTGP